jgi:hypothetical protein
MGKFLNDFEMTAVIPEKLRFAAQPSPLESRAVKFYLIY